MIENKRKENLKSIHLAGGCFWGVQAYLKRLDGVIDTEVGYANGRSEYPTYEQVCNEDTGHVEIVRVTYDSAIIGLEDLLDAFFKVVDPTLLNRQGNDIGTQYRTGVYYSDSDDKDFVKAYEKKLAQAYDKPIMTEFTKLESFYPAEEYHQDYLDKNPGGYCHIKF